MTQGALRMLLFSPAKSDVEREKERILAGLPRLGQQATVCDCLRLPLIPHQASPY